MKRAPIGRPFFVHPAWPKVSPKETKGLAQTKHLTKRCYLPMAITSSPPPSSSPSSSLGANSADLGWLGRLAKVGLWLGFPCAGGVLVAFGFLEAR